MAQWSHSVTWLISPFSFALTGNLTGEKTEHMPKWSQHLTSFSTQFSDFAMLNCYYTHSKLVLLAPGHAWPSPLSALRTQSCCYSVGSTRQFAFPQIELFSFGHDLVISTHLSPPAAQCLALPAANPSLFLLVGWRCCSNWLVYNPLLHASGTFNSLDGKWYLCMNVSAFKVCNFF